MIQFSIFIVAIIVMLNDVITYDTARLPIFICYIALNIIITCYIFISMIYEGILIVINFWISFPAYFLFIVYELFLARFTSIIEKKWS